MENEKSQSDRIKPSSNQHKKTVTRKTYPDMHNSNIMDEALKEFLHENGILINQTDKQQIANTKLPVKNNVKLPSDSDLPAENSEETSFLSQWKLANEPLNIPSSKPNPATLSKLLQVGHSAMQS